MAMCGASRSRQAEHEWGVLMSVTRNGRSAVAYPTKLQAKGRLALHLDVAARRILDGAELSPAGLAQLD